jgi:hypothetical protein
VIHTVEDTRASSAVTSTSPVEVPTGCEIVSVDPTVVAITTDPVDGRTLSALPDPDVITPRTSASARNARRRSSRAIFLEDVVAGLSDAEMGPLLNVGSIFISPSVGGLLGGAASLRNGSVSAESATSGRHLGPTLVRQLALGEGFFY